MDRFGLLLLLLGGGGGGSLLLTYTVRKKLYSSLSGDLSW